MHTASLIKFIATPKSYRKFPRPGEVEAPPMMHASVDDTRTHSHPGLGCLPVCFSESRLCVVIFLCLHYRHQKRTRGGRPGGTPPQRTRGAIATRLVKDVDRRITRLYTRPSCVCVCVRVSVCVCDERRGGLVFSTTYAMPRLEKQGVWRLSASRHPFPGCYTLAFHTALACLLSECVGVCVLVRVRAVVSRAFCLLV